MGNVFLPVGYRLTDRILGEQLIVVEFKVHIFSSYYYKGFNLKNILKTNIYGLCNSINSGSRLSNYKKVLSGEKI